MYNNKSKLVTPKELNTLFHSNKKNYRTTLLKNN